MFKVGDIVMAITEIKRVDGRSWMKKYETAEVFRTKNINDDSEYKQIIDVEPCSGRGMMIDILVREDDMPFKKIMTIED